MLCIAAALLQETITFVGEPAVLEGHDAAVIAVQFGPDSKRLFSADGEKLLVRDGERSLATIIVEGPAAISQNGDVIAAAGLDSLTLYGNAGKEIQKTITSLEYFGLTPGDMIIAVALAKDGSRFAVCGYQDLAVIVAPASDVKKPIRLKHGPADCIALSPDGKTFVTGNSQGSISIYSADNGELLKQITGSDRTISCLTFSSDGKYLAAGSEDGTARIYATLDWKELRKFDTKGIVFAVAFSPDGSHLAYTYNIAAQQSAIEIATIASGNVVAKLPKLDYWVFSLAFSPNGKSLAAGCEDTKVRIWPLRNTAAN